MNKAFTVSDVIAGIKDLLEGTFLSVSVEGEVTNLSSASSGHYYFTLSDENSALSCALFKMDAMRNPTIRRVKNGDKVVVTGPISVYAKRGTFQLLAKQISLAGKGDLAQQFLKLKEKLTAQGMFDPAHKKPIPAYIGKLAVITALQGAALQDFLNIMRRRCMWYNIVIIPSLVQGDQAPKSLVKSLKLAQQVAGVEAVLLTRGGGSLEDLWAFNDESLVRAIYDCPLPVISAVGHQTDITLCDLVSDLRCETPSAAAEVISQHQKELKQKLKYLGLSLKNFISETSASIHRRIAMVSPKRMGEILTLKVAAFARRLHRSDLRGKLYDLTRIHESYQYIDELQGQLFERMRHRLNHLDTRLAMAQTMLNGINPRNVLGRGYSYLQAEDNGQVVTNLQNFKRLPQGAKIKVHFSDGNGTVTKGE